MRYAQVVVCETIDAKIAELTDLNIRICFHIMQAEPQSPDSIQAYYSSIINKV